MKKFFSRNTRRKTEWTNDEKEKVINTLDFAIDASDGSDDYAIGFRNGLRYAKALIDGNDPQYEHLKQEPQAESESKIFPAESESKFFAKVAESYCKGLQDGLTAESEDK